MDYADLCNRLRTATKLPLLQALMNEAADALEALVGAEKRKTEKDAPLTEYISREAALSAQNKSMNLSECRKRLERIPAADVRPVVRGRWNVLDECSNEGIYCSECHAKIFDFTHKPKKKLSNYCPNCGAQMEG